MIEGKIKRGCIKCGGEISIERAMAGLPCERCGDKLCGEREGKLKEFCELERKVKAFEEFFLAKTGKRIYSLQRAWARRYFLGRSFGIIAPTGVGKTTFGITLSMYVKRALIVLPTTLLVEHVEERIREMGGEALAIHSKLKKKEREEKEERLEKGDFSMAIVTSAYLYRHWEKLRHQYDLIFVDDVDSLLKSSKNVDKLLMLVGFEKEEIERAAKGERVERKIKTRLIVSSATIKPKTRRVVLFYNLLGFTVGKSATLLRNIVDVVVRGDKEGLLKEIARKLKDGFVVFVKEKEEIERVREILREEGITSYSYEEVNEEKLEEFREGKVNALVGLANPKNPLARGIDMPERIKYAVFYGTPSLRFRIREVNETTAKMVGLALYRITGESRLLYLVKGLPKTLEKLKAEVEEKLKDREIVDRINKEAYVSLYKDEEGWKVIVGDVAAYLQGSGRTSRMYEGGVLKGLSILISDDEKAFQSLAKRIRWFKEGKPFLEIDEVDLGKVIEEIEEERRKLRGKKEEIKSYLAIVESPTKVKTITKLFSPTPVLRRIGNILAGEFTIGNKLFLIAASIGHVLDLVTREARYGVVMGEKIGVIYDTIKKCKDNGKQFVDERECEAYDKLELIEGLKEALMEVDEVLIATDPDREGEKIGFDLSLFLKPLKRVRRIEFHAITRREFLKAVEKMREIDLKRVKSQIVRRVADRLVGFELSNVAKKAFGDENISIGRVQTPVLGYVIEAWKESKEKVREISFEWDGLIVREKIGEKKLGEEVEAKKIKEEIKEVFPPKPFTTDEMIREANRVLRFPAPKVMEIAQSLFEKGLITYHRTDSHHVSDEGRRIAKEYIEEKLGDYYVGRSYEEGGAHEAIRPTKAMDRREVEVMYELSREEVTLYDLIFKRFMASQMKAAKVKVAKVVFLSGEVEIEREVVEEVVERGFDLVLSIKTYRIAEGRRKVEIVERKVPKKYPLTQGELIALMKERGIGRPSTYATIVSILLKRKYVKEIKGRLIPTKKGIALHTFARREFEEFTSEKLTRELEELIDEVEEGKDYQEALKYIVKKLDSALDEYRGKHENNNAQRG